MAPDDDEFKKGSRHSSVQTTSCNQATGAGVMYRAAPLMHSRDKVGIITGNVPYSPRVVQVELERLTL